MQRGHLLATAQTTGAKGWHELGKQKLFLLLFFSSFLFFPSKSTHDHGTLGSTTHLPDAATVQLPKRARVWGLPTHLSKHLKGEGTNSARAALAPEQPLLPRPESSQGATAPCRAQAVLQHPQQCPHFASAAGTAAPRHRPQPPPHGAELSWGSHGTALPGSRWP